MGESQEDVLVDVWIGLAHVKPRPGNDLLDGAIGAFVPSLALAENEEDYASKVTALLSEYGFHVLDLDDIERFEERLKRFPVHEDIVALVSSLSPEEPVALSDFDAYEHE